MGLLLLTATFPALAQDLTVCAGKGFKLISAKDAIGTSEVTYRWFQNEELMDASIYNAASITISGGKSAPGVYAYVREASNSACTLSSNTYRVEVLAAPDAPTDASSNARCGSGTVTFSATTATAGSTIDWYDAPIGGSTVTGGYGKTSFSSSITAPTTYYAQSRNTTTGCVSSSRLPVGGTVNALPVVSSVSASTLCAGGTSKLTATLSSGTTSAMTYSWNIGGTTSTTSVNTKTTEALNANTAFTVTVTNSNGCTSARKSGTITVNALPVVASVSAPATCAGSTAKLTATLSSGTTSAMTYSWNIGGTTSTTSVNTKTSQTLNANTAFTVTVTNSNGCTSAAKAGTISITSGAASGQTPNACGCASGSSECNGTCVSSGCTDCTCWPTTCSGITFVTTKTYDNNTEMDHNTAAEHCYYDRGMWLPTLAEMRCMCQNASSVPGGLANGYYWTLDAQARDKYYVVYYPSCQTNILNPTDGKAYAKCVR